jgi:DNA-binding MarR family transcriptional regulator
VAFLLAQLGAEASARYAERVAVLELSPGHTGLLRLIAMTPGMNQQTLAGLLRVTPSKVVALVDELQAKGLMERRRNETDRRAAALYLTKAGEQMMAQVAAVAREHEFDVTTALTDAERCTLIELLGKIAQQRRLTPGVHPGYRTG